MFLKESSGRRWVDERSALGSNVLSSCCANWWLSFLSSVLRRIAHSWEKTTSFSKRTYLMWRKIALACNQWCTVYFFSSIYLFIVSLIAQIASGALYTFSNNITRHHQNSARWFSALLYKRPTIFPKRFPSLSKWNKTTGFLYCILILHIFFFSIATYTVEASFSPVRSVTDTLII